MIRGRIADIIVATYLAATLYLRLQVETSLTGRPLISIGVGVVMLLFLWATIKVGLLAPDYFGLLKRSKRTS